ncbi:hypothetical protein GWK47_022723 [Chionoecetes opilio]|uniref:Tesmin/TSO1-like CXC domain-containing protein n=1 Tax=Chionoecetes opilio TaxID=41210 RepID=A0A8J4XN84_CHIOP|nr:hypothetical protein GWK47_022723 [Chionoecetes opilio]
MSDIRYRHWISSMARKSAASVHQLNTLPPTSEAFVENVKRAHFQACIWRSALTREAPDMDPLENGWVSDDDFGVLIPVTLPPQTEIAPAAVMKLIQCGCSSETPCSTERCGCVASQMSCSAFCRCRAEIRKCRNRWTLLKQRIEDANDSDEDESNDEDDIVEHSPTDRRVQSTTATNKLPTSADYLLPLGTGRPSVRHW